MPSQGVQLIAVGLPKQVVINVTFRPIFSQPILRATLRRGDPSRCFLRHLNPFTFGWICLCML